MFRKDRYKQVLHEGFTLIEICIVIMVIGVLMAAFFPAYGLYVKEVQKKKLEMTFTTVRGALADYIIDDPLDAADGAEKRYPCPSSLSAQVGTPEYGTENCVLRNAPAGTCSGGVCVVAGSGGRNILIGTVPTRTLGLASADMNDPYGNRLAYAVTADLTVPNAVANLSAAGSITVNDEATAITNTGQFVLLSHGRDGAGSYLISGVQNAANCRATNRGDAENCNNDGLFRYQLGQVNARNDDFFDDALIFSLTSDDDFINTACNPGQVMRGIVGRSPICENLPPPLNLSCPNPGEVLKSVQNGNAVCAPSTAGKPWTSFFLGQSKHGLTIGQDGSLSFPIDTWNTGYSGRLDPKYVAAAQPVSLGHPGGQVPGTDPSMNQIPCSNLTYPIQQTLGHTAYASQIIVEPVFANNTDYINGVPPADWKVTANCGVAPYDGGGTQP